MPIDPSERMTCPPPEVWQTVIEGVVAEQEATRLLSHAADCDACAANLREATAIFSSESSAEEEQEMLALASSGPEWQDRLASKLAVPQIATRQPESAKVIRMRHPVLWTAIGTLAASIALVALWQVKTRNSTETLLAAAYNSERRTDLRFPGGLPVPLHSPERGLGAGHDNPELLEARLRAEKALEKNPASAAGHELLGRILILENDPESALVEFQRAQSKEPTIPRLQFDLGMAYYELAEARIASGDRSYYVHASDAFSLYLNATDRTDPVALYNRSLCSQKLGDYPSELKDLSAALSAEKDASWRKAIEESIEKARSKLPATPDSKTSGASSVSGDDYERQLSDYTERDLSARDSHAATLASLGKAHGDAWLSDWLLAEGNARDANSANSLRSSVELNLSGAVADGLREATRARAAFAAEHNRAGWLRAEAEVIYSFRRMGQTRECLDELSRMPDTPAYSWMQADIALERAACVWQDGDFDRAKREAQSAIRIAEASHLPLLALRARGFLGGFLTQEGLLEEALSMNARGLGDSALFPFATMRRYQFLSDLAVDADHLGLHQSASLLGSEAVDTAIKTGNQQIAAYAWEVLGQYCLRAGSAIQAENAFQQADAALRVLGENPATRTYRADWSVDRARLDILRNHFEQGRQALQLAEPAVQSSHDLAIQQRYWSQRSELERLMGNFELAQASATRAAQLSEHALAKLLNVRQRAAWQLACEEQYLALVEALLTQHRDEEALRAWLQYRSAPERRPGMSVATANLAGLSAATVRAATVTLTYVRLKETYAVFIVRSGTVRGVRLQVSADRIDQLSRTYLILCSDPHSNPKELRELGSELYRALCPDLRLDAEELRVDLPRNLANLPFETLILADGTYLGSKVRIVNLAPAWGLHPPASDLPLQTSELLLVDASTTAPGRLRIPAAYDEATSISAVFPSSSVRHMESPSGAREVLAALHSADAFHFVGHAEQSNGSVRLLLASRGKPDSYIDPAALDGRSFKHCRLVFLAACSTNGTSDAIDLRMTLPTSFLRAGAEHVIASRWDADSEAASQLASHFYQALAKGNSPASAFHVAEESVRALPRFQHPYYWACFSHIEG